MVDTFTLTGRLRHFDLTPIVRSRFTIYAYPPVAVDDGVFADTIEGVTDDDGYIGDGVAGMPLFAAPGQFYRFRLNSGAVSSLLFEALDADETLDLDDVTDPGGTPPTPDQYVALNLRIAELEAGGGEGGAVLSVNGDVGVVVLDAADIAETSTVKMLTAAERTKLAGIAENATENSPDADLLNRANHTGLNLLASKPAGSTFVVKKDPTTGFWPSGWTANDTPIYTGGSASAGVRPTSRGDIMCIWKGPDPTVAVVGSGTAGKRDQTGGAIGDIRMWHP